MASLNVSKPERAMPVCMGIERANSERKAGDSSAGVESSATVRARFLAEEANAAMTARGNTPYTICAAAAAPPLRLLYVLLLWPPLQPLPWYRCCELQK